jgi:phi13 family phage major tail protein
MDYTLINGVDKLYYAKVTQDDADGYAADAPLPLAPLGAAVQTPSSNKDVKYFDNKAMFSLSAEGETKLKFDITDLPIETQAALLGKVYDSTTESMYDGDSTPPDMAVGFRALNSDGTYTLYWFLKGNFTPYEETANTKTASPDAKGISLEYTAIYTIHEFALDGSITKSVKRRKSSKQADVATWFDDVKVPVVGSPASLTATPSPVDGASAQATTVAITVTFSNPLAAGAERGIGLVREDTQAAIAVTRSISADRKTVTLAHAALTAAKTYLITVTGVKDMYGQSLTDVVYDFDTA